MLYIKDFDISEDDDIIINDDLELDENLIPSSIRTLQRRISARGDDFLIDINIAAGLEKYLYGDKVNISHEDILRSLNNVILENNLFSPQDYNIFINETNDRRINIFIKLNIGSSEYQTFKIVIDQQNQSIWF